MRKPGTLQKIHFGNYTLEKYTLTDPNPKAVVLAFGNIPQRRSVTCCFLVHFLNTNTLLEMSKVKFSIPLESRIMIHAKFVINKLSFAPQGRHPVPFLLFFIKFINGGVGGGHSRILQGFWQHKIDIKRPFEVRIVTK